MEGVTLNKESISKLGAELFQLFKDNGYMLLEEKAAKFTYKFYEQRKKLLSKKWVTTHQIQEYDLMIGIKSRDTVKNMVKNNKIPTSDFLYEIRKSVKVLKISTRFIKQFNNTT